MSNTLVIALIFGAMVFGLAGLIGLHALLLAAILRGPDDSGARSRRTHPGQRFGGGDV